MTVTLLANRSLRRPELPAPSGGGGGEPANYVTKTFVGTNGVGVGAGGTGTIGSNGGFFSSFSSGYGAFYSNAQTRDGRSTSMALKIANGSNGDPTDGGIGGLFGFVIGLPTELICAQGDTIHWGMWIYFESGFRFDTPSGGLKTLRMTRTGTTAQVDVLSQGTTSNTGFIFSNESDQSEITGSTRTTSRVISPGTWQWIEHAITWHSVGANSMRRLWIADQLVMEIVGAQVKWFDGTLQSATLGSAVATLQNSSAQHTQEGVFTYFNGGSPREQTVWIDAFVWHKGEAPLTNTDDQGNKIIGSTVVIP